MAGTDFKNGAEKLKYYRELKKAKQRENYNARKEFYNTNKKVKRQKVNIIPKKETLRKRIYRQNTKEHEFIERQKRQQSNAKKKEYRRKEKELHGRLPDDGEIDNFFSSRTQKHRALKKLRQNLPTTPKKRAALLSCYLSTKSSPTIDIMQRCKKIPSPEDVKNVQMAEAVLSDMKNVVDKTKQKRSDDARSAINIMTAAINGENVQKSKCRIELSKKLGFTTRRMSTGKRIRTTVLSTEDSAWKLTKRKTRNDAISDEHKQIVYDFWISPENSRPTGNKNDLKRARLGPKIYASHMKFGLEKTQTEVYLAFKEKFPNFKISQRMFEKLKTN